MSHSESSNKTNTTTNTRTTNAPNTIGGNGQILALNDNNVEGSEITFVSSDPDIVRAAIDSVKSIAQGASEGAARLAEGSAANSARIASEVAASQRKFLETQTGQGSLKMIVLTAGAVAATAYVFPKIFKN